MMRDDFVLGRRALGLGAQNFRGAAVQRLAAALEQALVGRILDQRVLEAIGRLGTGALDEEEVRVDEPVERGLQGGVGDHPVAGLGEAGMAAVSDRGYRGAL